MEPYSEVPDTRWDRVFCIAGAAASLAGMGWLAWRVMGDLEQVRTVEFIVMALLVGLFCYFMWLVLALSTVRYTLQGDRLVLQQAWSRLEVPLSPDVHLYRWRQRWSWDGGAQRDLNVESLRLFPPFWLWREEEMWVLQVHGVATAIRPGPRLLSEIKARVRQAGGLAG